MKTLITAALICVSTNAFAYSGAGFRCVAIQKVSDTHISTRLFEVKREGGVLKGKYVLWPSTPAAVAPGRSQQQIVFYDGDVEVQDSGSSIQVSSKAAALLTVKKESAPDDRKYIGLATAQAGVHDSAATGLRCTVE